MYTECPSCKTFFKITPNQLKAAGGRVRCGNCDEVFSALDGLVDVVPEEAVSQAQNERASSSALSSVETAAEATDGSDSKEKTELEFVETPESQAELSESAFNDTKPVEEKNNPQSFADVEIPGVNAPESEFDISEKFESSLAEDVDSAVEREEKKAISRQDAIINDIDAALDGLFDENSEMPDATDAESKSKPGGAAVLSAVSELDELPDLDFKGLDGGAATGNVASESPSLSGVAKSSVSEPIADSDKSSLSDFERELGAVSAAVPLKSEPLVESSFDLGDSFLDSDISGDDAKPGKKTDELDQEKGKDKDKRPGDSYILEAIEEKKKVKSSGGLAKFAWIVVILILLVVLVGQFAYLKRQDLVAYPEVKPVIESLCAKLNAFYPCDISPAKDIEAIELLESNVVSHPNAENALLITSTITNKADFDQAFPGLILTFSDINQKVIARRKFTPSEYLSKEVDITAGMKKSVPYKIMLEIVDPGEEAVNFEFDFQ